MPIPKLAVTVGLMAVQVALQATQRIKGPRLESLKTTTADYGTPINRFWGTRRLDCPVIWAEDLREVKKTSKGKAGKNTQYKYYASFAVLIADHEIDAVSKIWMDDKLVYDATGSGPISVGSAANVTLGQNMRVYLGTETQLPDPRMEAWCEDRYGADSCPAYRGSAYVVFEDLPVNNFGNRIPNISIESVSNKLDNFPYEINNDLLSGGILNSAISPGKSRLVVWNSGGGGFQPDNFQVWDLATRTIILENPISIDVGGHDIGMRDEDSFYATANDQLYLVTLQGSVTQLTTDNNGVNPGPAQYCAGQVFLSGSDDWKSVYPRMVWR